MRDVARVALAQLVRVLCETAECMSVADSFLLGRTASDSVGCCLSISSYAPPPQKVYVAIALVILPLLLIVVGAIGVLMVVWRIVDLVREYLVMLCVLALSLTMSTAWWALMIARTFDSPASIALWLGIELAQILVCVVVAMLSLKWLFAFVFLIRGEAWLTRTERIVSGALFGFIGAWGVVGLGCFISIALGLQ